MEENKLVAVCGLYCGACSMYRADHDDNEPKLKELAQQFSARLGANCTVDDIRCDGCRGEGHLTPWCSKCELRLCPELQAGKVVCSDCKEFPCSRITGFNNDGMPHHSEVLSNLRQIRQIGIEDWAKQEKERWACPHCRTLLSWYESSCPHCRAPRPERLFPLPKG